MGIPKNPEGKSDVKRKREEQDKQAVAEAKREAEREQENEKERRIQQSIQDKQNQSRADHQRPTSTHGNHSQKDKQIAPEQRSQDSK